MTAYYNEFNPKAAAMLRQLIKDGLIAPGDVDERSITEVKADDLRGYTQCHFFAGIGGWSVALRLAMWSDDRPVWTGSCPCQPFSTAGKQKGQSDERHLWPHWFRLIQECRPPVVFGEQVAGAIAYGWWDEVASNLETQDYACASAVLPACSVGQPHKRDRLWFVADSSLCNDSGESRGHENSENKERLPERNHDWELSHAGSFMGDAESSECERSREARSGRNGIAGASEPSNVANTISERGRSGNSEWQYAGDANPPSEEGLQWIECPDGKSRPVESGVRLLVNGVQFRAPILHAFGNAIVPQVAAEFIKATM